MRILHVEDSEIDARMVSRWFESIAEIRQHDRVSSVTAADLQWCDLCLLDLNLPETRGVESVLAIMSKSQEVPIVVLTTDARDSTIHECFEAGADSVWTKGCEKDELARAMRTAANKKLDSAASKRLTDCISTINEYLGRE